MKIYVASHCKLAGLHVATVLESADHFITARWLHSEFKPTEQYSAQAKFTVAQEDYDDVVASEALVLVAGPDKYSGGKFVEAGIALGLGKRVVVVGRRENMLLWHPSIEQVETPEEAARLLGRAITSAEVA